MNESSEPTSGSKRQRSRQACESCRSRKRKCDGGLPCTQCSDYEYLCRYAEKHTVATPAKVRRLNLKIERSESSGAFSSPEMSNTDKSEEARLAQSTPFADGFSDSIRAKFAPAESAVAFPRLLSGELSPEAPGIVRLHCFGWNTGTRVETPKPNVDVTQYLTLLEAEQLSDVYFDIVHREIGFLDRNTYNNKVQTRWLRRSAAKEYDCVIAGVTSLGSFFLGANGHRHENELQKLLSEVLSISCGIYFPTVDMTGAWILRAIYLRLTTRPNASWTASCSMIHAIESAGLYKDHGSPPFSTDAHLDVAEIEYRRRLFWTAWSLHGVLCKEYGRTRIHLEITTKRPKLDNNVSAVFLSIAQCLEVKETSNSQSEKVKMLTTMLENLCDSTVETGFHQLLKTDMIFSVYRRLRLLQHSIHKPYEDRILENASAALSAAEELASDKRPFWNVVSCPFQTVCICLAVDSSESLSLLARAISTLGLISSVFNTFMVQEAFQVANTLAKLARDKKFKDLQKIESALVQDSAPNAAQAVHEISSVAGLPDDPLLWGWMNDTFAWDLVMPSEKGANGIDLTRSDAL